MRKCASSDSGDGAAGADGCTEEADDDDEESGEVKKDDVEDVGVDDGSLTAARSP